MMDTALSSKNGTASQYAKKLDHGGNNFIGFPLFIGCLAEFIG
jgi:hypothetical protein